MKATITKIQRFSVHDGPGIRTTVFLKGCNMRCLWCHNPENLNKGVELGFLAQRCTLCGECARVCPSMAIEIRDGVRSFDASKCSRCFKCEGVCVSSAITVYGAEYTPEELCEALLRDEKYYKKSGGESPFRAESLCFGATLYLLVPIFCTKTESRWRWKARLICQIVRLRMRLLT